MTSPRFPRHSVSRFLTLAAVMAAGCSPPAAPPPPPAATAVEVLADPAELSLKAGGQGQLSVQANDASGTPVGGATFRFSSADQRLLRVSERGLVTSVGPATKGADIIIASGRNERRVPVVVLPGAPKRVELLSEAHGTAPQNEVDDAGLIAVRVTDAFSNPVPDLAITVRFAELADVAQSARTDGHGIARIKRQSELYEVTTLIVEADEDSSVRQKFRIEADAPQPPAASSAAQ